MPRPPWIKLWTEEWLDGSIRMDLTADERSVWADLLAMAGRSRQPGVIQANEDSTYSHIYLAGRFQIPLELLERTLEKCKQQNRISENSSGIEIINWKKYQQQHPKSTSTKAANNLDLNLAAISKTYEDNIGTLTPLLGDQLEAIAKEYSVEWFTEAVQEACKAGVRKLNYIEAILERWKTEGFKSKKKEAGDGKAGRYTKTQQSSGLHRMPTAEEYDSSVGAPLTPEDENDTK